jgi:hypothetical protein
LPVSLLEKEGIREIYKNKTPSPNSIIKNLVIVPFGEGAWG